MNSRGAARRCLRPGHPPPALCGYLVYKRAQGALSSASGAARVCTLPGTPRPGQGGLPHGGLGPECPPGSGAPTSLPMCPPGPSADVWGSSAPRPPAHPLGSDEPCCVFVLGGGANLLEQGRFSEQPGVRGRQGEDREGAGALQGLGAGVRDSVCSTAWGGHWAPRLSSRARRSPVRPCSPAGRAPSPGQALPPSEGDRRHLAPGWGHQGAPTCQPTSPLPPTFSPRPAASCPPTDHREAHGGRVLGSGAGGAGALCRVPPTFSLTCLAARTAAQGPPPPGVQSRWAVGPSKTASPTPASPTPHHDHHDLGKPNGSWEPGVGSWPGGGT